MSTGLASQRLAPGSAHRLCCVSYRPRKEVPTSPTFLLPGKALGSPLLLYYDMSETKAKHTPQNVSSWQQLAESTWGGSGGERERGGLL